MWYQIVPTVAIIGAASWIPQLLGSVFSELAFNRPFRRDLSSWLDRYYFLRDVYLTGDVSSTYATGHMGLENIPDE